MNYPVRRSTHPDRKINQFRQTIMRMSQPSNFNGMTTMKKSGYLISDDTRIGHIEVSADEFFTGPFLPGRFAVRRLRTEDSSENNG